MWSRASLSRSGCGRGRRSRHLLLGLVLTRLTRLPGHLGELAGRRPGVLGKGDLAEVDPEGRQLHAAADHARSSRSLDRLDDVRLRLEDLIGARPALQRLAGEPDEAQAVQVVQVLGNAVGEVEAGVQT